MITSAPVEGGLLALSHLPSFAQFLLNLHLNDFVRTVVRLSRKVEVPLLKHLAFFSEDQLHEFARETTADLLTHIAQNKVAEYIEKSNRQWVANQLPRLDKDQITAQDITLIPYVRKQAFLAFLTEYTSNVEEVIELVREIDLYVLEEETRSTQTYIHLLQTTIRKQLHLNERITNTSPGIVYVFDLVEHKEVFSNQKAEVLLGYTHEEFQAMGTDYLNQMQHPDDISRIIAHFQAFEMAEEGEVRTFEHRLRDKQGRYHWLRNYESVFQRDESGKPTQIIGIALDITQEKYNAEQLQKREVQLLEAQSMAQFGSFEWNLTTGETYLTPEAMMLLGIEKAGQFGNILDGVHPDDQGRLQATITTAVETQGAYDCEYRYRGQGGEKLIWLRGRSMTDAGQSIVKGILMDVTSQKQLLQRLQQSEELYKQSQALTHIGNWSWDVAENKVSWSDEMFRIYGLQPQSEEITFERFISLVHPDDRALVTQQVQQSIATREPNDFYHRILLPDQRVRILHALGEVLVNEAGAIVRMIGTGQDVTEQKQAEQSIRASQVFIQKITDTTPSIIASYNVNTGQYQFVSQGLEKLLGYPAQLVLDQGVNFFFDIIHPDDLQNLAQRNTEALHSYNQPDAPEDGVVDFTYRMRHRDGEYRWIRTYGTVFDRDEYGRVNHVLNISLDITEQVKAEQLIAANTRQLERSNASLREFAYIASHDLKEPLRKISTLADRLLVTHLDKLDAEGQLFLGKIVTAATRMQRMINDVLSVSQLSHSQTFVPYSLQQVLDETLALLEHKITERQAVFDVTPLPVADIIPAQFQQLFLNLLTNSLKFARPGQPVRIQIQHRLMVPDEVTNYTLPMAEQYHRLDFIDDGIGFDNQFSSRIFNIFQRLHAPNTYEGTGIGLAICRRVAENHKGIIMATGAPNKGATFTVIFPNNLVGR